MKKVFKSNIVKFISVLIIIIFLGWGGILSAMDDIKSASNNFSIIGIVSNIKDGEIGVVDAKGSDNSGKTSYDLNTEYIENIQTDTYAPITVSSIKVGDKIIVQGLTNGSRYFAKRIISFSKDVIVATTTEVVIATTDTINGSTTENLNVSSSTTPVGVSDDLNDEVIKSATITSSVDTSTTSTETATMDEATTTVGTATSTNIITEVVETIKDTVIEIVNNVIDIVTGNNNASTTPDTSSQTVTETPAATTEPVIETTSAPTEPAPVPTTETSTE